MRLQIQHGFRRLFNTLCFVFGVGFFLHGLLSSSLLANEPAKATRPPNVILFLVDDMGWRDLACYGNEFHETPNINKLAAAGMQFSDAYAACPVCSPTRASILTGKYPASLNLTDFIPGHFRPFAKLTVPKFNQQLPLEEITIAEILKESNYQTASFGKWHLGGRNHFPDRQGFDDWTVTGGRHFSPKFGTTPREKVQDGTYLGDFLTDKAETFIDKNKDRPFFLYLPHYAVHIPLEAKQELIRKYEQKSKPDYGVNNPIYAAMVEHIDNSVGRLVKQLDALKLTDNTIFILFSDNGGLFKRYDAAGPEVMSNEPLRAEKGTVYEGGIRVPFIVKWPGHIPAGKHNSSPMTSADLLPTIADLTGSSKSIPAKVDGISLKPALLNESSLPERSLYWHYPHYHHCAPSGVVRRGDYKLIEEFEEGKLELYHLKSDLGEQQNLVQEQPEIAKQLHDDLVAWRNRVGANLPTSNPNWNVTRAGEWHRRPRPRKK